MQDDLLALRRDNTLSSLLADRLESFIMSGRLPAGERINEAVLARELGVSRGPIREAARLLASQGLVEFVANKGAFVRQIDREELLDIYQMRALTGYAGLRHARRRFHRARKPARADVGRRRCRRHDALLHAQPALPRGAGGDVAFEPAQVHAHALVKEQHLYRQMSLRRTPT